MKEQRLPLNLSKVDDIYIPTNTAIFVDENKLVFPLALRRWKEGIVFNLCMEGKSKKVSFFKDTKLSLLKRKYLDIVVRKYNCLGC
jgi:tRNA(Ile)-lysidine synthase